MKEGYYLVDFDEYLSYGRWLNLQKIFKFS